MRKDVHYSPIPPSYSPERTSVGAPDCFPSPQFFYSSLLHCSNSNLLLLLCCGITWSAKVLLPLWRSNTTTIQVWLDLFFWPPAKGPDERLLPRERRQTGSRDRSHYCTFYFFLFFFTAAWRLLAPLSEDMCTGFHKHTKMVLFSSFSSSWLSCLLTFRPWDVVMCDWCQRLVEGRKKWRKHQADLDLPCLIVFCPVYMFINPSFISFPKHSTSVRSAISFCKNRNIIFQSVTLK